jgi:hypothetical protein
MYVISSVGHLTERLDLTLFLMTKRKVPSGDKKITNIHDTVTVYFALENIGKKQTIKMTQSGINYSRF